MRCSAIEERIAARATALHRSSNKLRPARSSRSHKCRSARSAAYDRAHFFAARDRFLECWISQPHAVGLAFIDDGQLKGYGVLRKCRVGHKIGPLFADAPDIAGALFGALCNNRSSSIFRSRTRPASGSPPGMA
jgi:Acetyltransferase (GNAT) domain